MDPLENLVREYPITTVVLVLGLMLLIIAVRDILQRRHAIVHNFPVVGHLRYLFETIGPELRQYFFANDLEEKPFNRAERRWVYATSKKENNTFGFGTSELIYEIGYPILKHATFPISPQLNADDPTAIPCRKVVGAFHKRKRPYQPTSIINISAMSYGSLGARAIESINRGCAKAKAFHNTGEGSISPYHQQGADLVWQLGTGYYGARSSDGNLDMAQLVKRASESPNLRMIEIKLSQGAKPGKGGILPGSKVTPEIAQIRGIPVGKDCLSPNGHQAFSTVDELIDVIEEIAAKTGLPVGIKSAVGQMSFWHELASSMKERNQGPDMITIDGGEGGTGAAPLTFSDHVSLPFKVGFARVYQVFLEHGITERIVWNGSAKLGFPDRAIIALAMGCDMISVAREAMLAVGCIQAQKCHTGHCPAGVATQNAWLQSGLDVTDKSDRLANYLKGFRKELLALSHAAGYEHPSQFRGDDIEFASGVNDFKTLTEILGYERSVSNETSPS